MKNKKKRSVDTYIIVFFVVLAATISTHFIPRGYFETKDVSYTQGSVEHTKKALIPESFQFEKDEEGSSVVKGVGFFRDGNSEQIGFLNFMYEGLVSGGKWSPAVGLIALLLIIGGSFGIILRTGSVESAIYSVAKKLKGYELFLIGSLFFMFSLGGAIFGMAEETLPFLMVFIPMFLVLGYDSITAIMVVFGASQVGFATSWMNPFSVQIAQGIAQVPILSGSTFRMIMWLFFTILSMVMVIMYAKKIKKNPKLSLCHDTDKEIDFMHTVETMHKAKMKKGDYVVLSVFFAGIAWVMWGVVSRGYYLPELSGQFFTMGLVIGLIGVLFKLNNMTFNEIPKTFRKGAEEFLSPAILVAMATSVLIILGGTDPSKPTVLNSILHYAGSAVSGLPSYIGAWFMYIFQATFNFFVVSGSGKAALTMPLLAPISDMAGITRQVAVLAFQLGDGFTNLIVPTNAILIGILAVAKVEWTKWAKFQLKYQLIFFVIATIFLFLAVGIGYN
jgi:uncharacterized ion transporter superfamily protein YfcC